MLKIYLSLFILSLSYPLESISGKYGGGVKVNDNFHWNKKYLNTEQIDLLEKLLIGKSSEIKTLLRKYNAEKLSSVKEGKDLIKFFSILDKNNKRNLPVDNIEKWELFKKYCIRDVEVEREIRDKLKIFHLSNEEEEIYILDQEINDRGIKGDEKLVNHAIKCDKKFKEYIKSRAFELTNLNNPNSPA